MIRQLEVEADELAATLETERASAAADAMRTAREAAELEMAERLAAAVAAGEAQRAAGDAAQQAAHVRVADAVRAIDGAQSLSEALDAFVTGARSEAPRVALLLVDRDCLRAWRCTGFGWAVDNRSSVEVPLSDAGVVGLAVQTGTVASGDGVDIMTTLFRGTPEGREPVALPVQVGGQVVAVLYADRGTEEADMNVQAGWILRLETMARHTARALEAITAVRTLQLMVDPGRAVAVATGDEARSATSRLEGELAIE